MEITRNKKAFFDYEILDKIEAGLVLRGFETKAVKNGQINLKGAYVTLKNSEPGITNMHISKYKPAGKMDDYEPEVWRKLLLHKNQIAQIKGKMNEKGLTILPLRVYTKGRLIKVEIGIGKGKKLFNKKNILLKRAQNREIQRALKLK
ncbi:MAG: SsrA-binding protein SmpB [bacterium]